MSAYAGITVQEDAHMEKKIVGSYTKVNLQFLNLNTRFVMNISITEQNCNNIEKIFTHTQFHHVEILQMVENVYSTSIVYLNMLKVK